MSSELSMSDWFAAGKTDVFPEFSSEPIFYRLKGKSGGKLIVFLHGFPTSSYDFHKIAAPFEDRYEVLAIDFLGFGYSGKPAHFRYSILSQADLVEKVLARTGRGRAHLLVAHDYGASVAQELLARKFNIDRVCLLNGGIYPDLHRPLLTQKLLANRLFGPLISRLVTKRVFFASFRKIFSAAHPPTDDDLEAHWSIIRRKSGNRIYHKLIHYMEDRRRYRERWVGAMETTKVPLGLIWGMEDPISGRPVFERAKSRIGNLFAYPLENVGHYPHLEVPGAVVHNLERFLNDPVSPVR